MLWLRQFNTIKQTEMKQQVASGAARSNVEAHKSSWRVWNV